MSRYHNLPILKIALSVVLLQLAIPASAQLISKNVNASVVSIASAKRVFKADTGTVRDEETAAVSPDEAAYTANPETSLSKPKERRQLLGLLKKATADDEVAYNQSRTKFLYSLANVFTKLRLYPLAMKTFLKTTGARGDKHTDSLYRSNGNAYLGINSVDDSLIAGQVALAGTQNFNHKKSKPTSYQYISNTLNDGKTAAAYAMLFHVKQPAPGKRKVHVWGDTGHTFITLIKYNVDSTYSSFSFGFYPKKRNPLSATPLVPATSSVLKDDTDHTWDEVAGKFISQKKFEKILALTKQYDNLEYHLSNNNCTDFGLKAAQLAGIDIKDTNAKWPLGRGNAPAATGQSILEGKVSNVDTGNGKGVFVNTVVVVP